MKAGSWRGRLGVGFRQTFLDDFATRQNEASGGRVDDIAVYDAALAAAEISTLDPTAVPEPFEWALMLSGLGTLARVVRRKR